MDGQTLLLTSGGVKFLSMTHTPSSEIFQNQRRIRIGFRLNIFLIERKRVLLCFNYQHMYLTRILATKKRNTKVNMDFSFKFSCGKIRRFGHRFVT